MNSKNEGFVLQSICANMFILLRYPLIELRKKGNAL